MLIHSKIERAGGMRKEIQESKHNVPDLKESIMIAQKELVDVRKTCYSINRILSLRQLLEKLFLMQIPFFFQEFL
jgi:hypothetical protein